MCIRDRPISQCCWTSEAVVSFLRYGCTKTLCSDITGFPEHLHYLSTTIPNEARHAHPRTATARVLRRGDGCPAVDLPQGLEPELRGRPRTCLVRRREL